MARALAQGLSRIDFTWVRIEIVLLVGAVIMVA
jgi:hypothetical protein